MRGIEVGELLRRARAKAGLSQSTLARAGGTTREAINAYETGRRSPTVARLDQLLAACGLQARVELEPLLADVDARVDALTGSLPALDAGDWGRLVLSLDDRPGAMQTFLTSGGGGRRGPVTWAVDGPSALVLHRLAVPAADVEHLQVVVVLDEALRFWLRALMIVGHDQRERPVRDWLDADDDLVREALAEPHQGLLGTLRTRVVQELPPTVRLVVPWAEDPVAVVTVDEVERSHPAYRDVLARWRSRRAD